MPFIDHLIDAALRKLSANGPFRTLFPGLIEELHYIRLGRRKIRWIPLRKLASPGSQRERDLLAAIFSMLAILSKSGGRVSDTDLEALNEITDDKLRLSKQQKALAMEIMRKAKSDAVPFEAHAKRFRELANGEPEILASMIDGLVALTYASGFPKPPQERLINLASVCFGIDQSTLTSMRSRHAELADLRRELDEFQRDRRAAERRKVEQEAREALGGFGAQNERAEIRRSAKENSALDNAFKVLGCDRNDTKETVRKRYRKLALNHHPDKLRAKGLPEETLRQFERQFREINEAYEMIKRERGWR